MSEIKAIIFDLGGVILRHPKSPNGHVLAEIFKQPFSEVYPLYESLKIDYLNGKLSSDQFLQIFIDKYPTDLSISKIKELWPEVYRKLRFPDTEMLQILRDLKGKVICSVLTNNTPLNYDVNYKDGIFDYFDRKYISFKMKICKPDLKVYRMVIDDLGFPVSDLLFIDDKTENLEPAKKLGMKTYHFDILEHNPLSLREYFIKEGVLV
jgi:glucose-1-phosphatase